MMNEQVKKLEQIQVHVKQLIDVSLYLQAKNDEQKVHIDKLEKEITIRDNKIAELQNNAEVANLVNATISSKEKAAEVQNKIDDYIKNLDQVIALLTK